MVRQVGHIELSHHQGVGVRRWQPEAAQVWMGRVHWREPLSPDLLHTLPSIQMGKQVIRN